MLTFSVIGFGKVGGALSIALNARGHRIATVSGTSRERAEPVLNLLDPRPAFFEPGKIDLAESDVVLITVRDDQIKQAAESIAGNADINGKVVLHTSGSKDSGVLEPVHKAGAETGSLHPLVSVSGAIQGSKGFSGTFFCVEGTEKGAESAKTIASELGGRPFEIPTRNKPLYHAAAVMACGHLVALFEEAVETLSLCGPAPEEAAEILLPLVSSTVQNLSRQSTSEALTGTFARGDTETFRAHIEALRGSAPPAVLEAYLLLGERSLEIARRGGLDADKADVLEREIRNQRRLLD